MIKKILPTMSSPHKKRLFGLFCLIRFIKNLINARHEELIELVPRAETRAPKWLFTIGPKFLKVRIGELG